MRAAVSFVAFLCLHAATARAQDTYAAVLLEYLSGNADHAVDTLRRMSHADVALAVDAFDATRNQRILTAAAAMHTEVAIRGDGGFASTYHLQVATAIVEFGERRVGRSNTPLALHPRFAEPVSGDFRLLWYCTVITGLEGGGLLRDADRYLAHALPLYPGNAEILLLAGVAEEMRASPRTAPGSDGDRRKALGAAEKLYRAVVAAQPARLEARLRLARVLQQRHQLTEARALLTPLTSVDDIRIEYLASVFLAGMEDELQHADMAIAAYDRAAALLPIGQTARLAASELRHRRGDRGAAAEAIPAAAGANNSFDPWWSYVFGEYWRNDILLRALRAMRHTT